MNSNATKEIVIEHANDSESRVAIRIGRDATYAAMLATAKAAFNESSASASIVAYKGTTSSKSPRGELLGCLDELDEHLSLFDAEAQLRREFGPAVVFVFDPVALQPDMSGALPSRRVYDDDDVVDVDADRDDSDDSPSYSYDDDDDHHHHQHHHHDADSNADHQRNRRSDLPPPLPPDIDPDSAAPIGAPLLPHGVASRTLHKVPSRDSPQQQHQRKAATLKPAGRSRANDLITTEHGDTLFANTPARNFAIADKDAKAELLMKKFGARPRTELFAPDAVLSRHSQEQQQLHVLKTTLDAQVAAASNSAEHDEFFDKVGQTFKNIDSLPAALRETTAKRAYVREGALRRRVGSQWQERYFYLFSDVLIWVKPKLLSRRVEFKGLAWLDGAVLVAEPLDEELPPSTFTLLSGDSSDADQQEVHVLLCDEAARKSLWTTAIEFLIERHHQEHVRREEQKARVQQRLREKAQLIDAEVSAIEADERRRRERRRRREARRAADNDRQRSPRRHGGARPSSRNSNKSAGGNIIRQVARPTTERRK